MRNPLRAYVERIVRRELECYTGTVIEVIVENNQRMQDQLIEWGVLEMDAAGKLRKVDSGTPELSAHL